MEQLFAQGQAFYGIDGEPLLSGLIIVEKTTGEPLTTLSDKEGTLANTNPIILNSSGSLDNAVYVAEDYVNVWVKDSYGIVQRTISKLRVTNKNTIDDLERLKKEHDALVDMVKKLVLVNAMDTDMARRFNGQATELLKQIEG